MTCNWALLIRFTALGHIGVYLEPPQISPARGPPLWDDCSDAQTDEGLHIEPDWDLAAQPGPYF